MPRAFVISLAASLLGADASVAQEKNSIATVSFDDAGKLENPKAWPTTKDDIARGNPSHVFVITHGWRTSKAKADETVADFAKLLHAQKTKDEVIQVIGLRWPSLLGENDGPLDLALKQAAQSISKSMGKSETAKDYREKLKVTLNKPSTRLLVSATLRFQLPPQEQLERMIDNAGEVENVENALTMFSYYEMKRRANLVGSRGLQECLTQLQDAMPGAKFHLVGHSFGCKVCLACLACAERAGKQVESVTLLQGAVSAFCFADNIDGLKDEPQGAYADVPKRVKGCICITHTKNDKALTVAYVGASQAAGQVGELPGRHFERKLGHYAALGAKGIIGVADVPICTMCDVGQAYKLRRGLNAINADKIVQSHGDVRRPEVAWLIWSAARFQP
jgi:hypothetical protein